MPRIDPSQLLKTLSVLLSIDGGIKSDEEVGRLVQLMQKFSKKLVSKVIYINILQTSSPELLDHFLREKGWELLNVWFEDAIKTLNWPLCAKMTQLFTKCPMTAQRLKDNVGSNAAPKLIRQLSCDRRVDATVRQNASEVLSKWMAVVQPVQPVQAVPVARVISIAPVVVPRPSVSPVVARPSAAPVSPCVPVVGVSPVISVSPVVPTVPVRTTRGTRHAIVQQEAAKNSNVRRVPVIFHSDIEDIVNAENIRPSSSRDSSVDCEAQCWVGKGGENGILRGEVKALQERRGRVSTVKKTPTPPPPAKSPPHPSKSPPPPGRSKAYVDSDYDSDSDDERPRQDDPFKTLLSNSITTEKNKVKNTMKLIGVIRNESLDDEAPVKDVKKVSTNLNKEGDVSATHKEDKDVKKAQEKDKEREVKKDKESKEHKDVRKDNREEKKDNKEERKEGKENKEERKEIKVERKENKEERKEGKDRKEGKEERKEIKLDRKDDKKDVKKDVKDIRKEGKESKEERKDKDKYRDKYSDKERSKENDKGRDKSKDKDREREKDRDKYSDKEREKMREERRRKEREREKQKEKERRELKEKKRESKPYRETEMRDGLDTVEKQRIKELAQKMREQSKSDKKEDFRPSSNTSSMAKIPKIPKLEETKKDESKTSKKPGPSFEDLMFMMDSVNAKAPIKAAPIKNKSRDLIASLTEDASPRPKSPPKIEKQEIKKSILPPVNPVNHVNHVTDDKSSKIVKVNGTPNVSDVVTEEKSSKVMKSNDASSVEKKPDVNVESKDEKGKEEDKKTLKRPSTDVEPKLKIKSPAQLKESPIFGDFLSTIMPEQPKKKKIKLADLKAQKEAKAAAENIMAVETEIKDNGLEKSLADAASSFSFYRDTMAEESSSKVEETEDETAMSSPVVEDVPTPDLSDSEMPFEEPETGLTREVRGILVLTKGPKRTRRIQWRPQETLVEVEYFELDETERVNVNKLKFEEARQKELSLEKTSRMNSHLFVDSRPWPGVKKIDCQLPEVEYGSNSMEKKEQEQRENKVLQILFFNNKLPNDPSEPDTAGGAKVVTKPIPLEDTSGDEAYTDYSGEPWPLPILEKEASPSYDAVINNIQPNLIKNIMGGLPIPETGNQGMDAALYAAQKAAEAELRKHGALPPLPENSPPRTSPPRNPPTPPSFPPEEETGYYHPMGGTWSSGSNNRGGPPHHRGGPYNRNGGPPPDFRGGFRPGGGGGGPMRGYHHNQFNGHDNGYDGGFYDRRGGWEDRGGHRRDFGGNRPCRFWMEKGFCREDSRCKFSHPQR